VLFSELWHSSFQPAVLDSFPCANTFFISVLDSLSCRAEVIVAPQGLAWLAWLRGSCCGHSEGPAAQARGSLLAA